MKYLLKIALMLTCVSGLCQKIDKYNGFLKNVDGTYFFYEVSADSLLPGQIAVFKTDTVGLSKIALYYDPRGFNDEMHLSVSGTKSNEKTKYNGHEFGVITINDFEPFTLFDFIRNKKNNLIVYEETVETEGYFSRVFEGISYTAIENNTRMWTGSPTFSKELEAADSLKYILHRWNSRGMYLKVQGVKKYGSHHGYGHFGGFDSEILITKIIAADTTRTYKGFLRDKLLQDGFVTFGNDTLRPVDDLQMDKEYRLTASNGVNNYKLKVKKVSRINIEYTLEYYKRKKRKATVSGVVTLDPFSAWWYRLEGMRYFYESFNKYDHNGDALVKIEIGEMDATTGKRSIYIEDHLSGHWPVDGQLKLTEE